MNNLTFRISEIDWTETGSLVAVIISLTSAIIAGMARQDSKISAREAERARKINQAALLAEHFNNVEYLCNRILEGRRPKDDQSRIELAKQSETTLQSLLSDSKALTLLVDLVNTHDKYELKDRSGTWFPYAKNFVSEFNNTEELDKLRDNMTVIKKELEQVKNNYLKIG